MNTRTYELHQEIIQQMCLLDNYTERLENDDFIPMGEWSEQLEQTLRRISELKSVQHAYRSHALSEDGPNPLSNDMLRNMTAGTTCACSN